MPDRKLYSILKYGLYLWVFSALVAKIDSVLNILNQVRDMNTVTQDMCC